MQAVILYLVSALFNVGLFVFESQVLPKRIAVWKMVIGAFLVSLITVVRNSLPPSDFVMMVFAMMGWVLSLLCQLVFFKGKLWKRLLVWIYFAVIMTACDMAVGVLIPILSGNTAMRYMRDSVEYVAGGIIGLILFLIVGSISVMIWRIIETHKFQPFYLLFLILPVGQFFFMYHTFYSTGIFGFFGALLSLMADIVLLVYTVSQEKKTTLEAELQATRHIMELEQAHYNEVEQRREELARIRHDFNNQLAAINHLIRSGEDISAQDMIHTLADEIAQTKENLFCDIPVINAVLAEKQQELEASGARLHAELDIPQRLDVEKNHLCSIFSNLMDNAIKACRALTNQMEPTVYLSSMVEGDYLFIKTVNPSTKPPKRPEFGHGYGSRILADLAERYGGNYQTEYRNGQFFAVVSLQAARGT